MKRWAALLFLSLLVGVTVFVIQHARSEYEKKQREAEYQSILRRYSEALKPGITRKGVEAYLAAHQAKFSRFPVDDPNAYADITKIGEGDGHWYCSREDIYVAFQFIADPMRSGLPSALPSDTLKKIRIYSKLEDCL